MKNPTAKRNLERGRTAYWDEASNTIVIVNPAHRDLGTAYPARNGKSTFDELK